MTEPVIVTLTCDCGQAYEIRDDTPKWAAPWIMCGECFLADGSATLAAGLGG